MQKWLTSLKKISIHLASGSIILPLLKILSIYLPASSFYVMIARQCLHTVPLCFQWMLGDLIVWLVQTLMQAGNEKSRWVKRNEGNWTARTWLFLYLARNLNLSISVGYLPPQWLVKYMGHDYKTMTTKCVRDVLVGRLNMGTWGKCSSCWPGRPPRQQCMLAFVNPTIAQPS